MQDFSSHTGGVQVGSFLRTTRLHAPKAIYWYALGPTRNLRLGVQGVIQYHQAHRGLLPSSMRISIRKSLCHSFGGVWRIVLLPRGQGETRLFKVQMQQTFPECQQHPSCSSLR